MTRRLHLQKHISAILFVVFVAVTGVALAASGNLQNPLNAVPELTSLLTGTNTAETRERANPPTGETRGAPPSDMRGENGDQGSFQWSQIGSVLYNAWVIAAATAMMMFVGPLVGRGIKQIERLTTRLRPAKAMLPTGR